ncbi:MAG TPA: zinc ABC transporter substrate-binding protein [Dehalococcoidia bacterium]|nr:zinc ABC transporter substrate-binding protein [Dehalococcoidia bacterium]
MRVVATTTQIGDMAANVGGDRISLNVLLKPNQDAHDFEPQPSQIRALSQADVVLRHGLGLDGYVDKAVGGSGAEVATVTDGITTLAGAGEETGHPDPHVWFSVANAKQMVEDIRDALTRADPAGAAYYAGNATQYLHQLDASEAQIDDLVAGVPQACRKLVTNHDFLAYFANAYGFELVGSVIPSTSTEAAASAQDVASTVQAIKAQHVPAIFAEASVNPDLIRQVGREAGVKVVSDLYSDSLGPKSSDGSTYIKMMLADTQKITGALKDC